MNLSRKVALCLLLTQLVLLFIGTQMPGTLRDEAIRVSHLPWQMTKVAHFVVFACMAAVAHLPPLRVPVLRIALAALALALVTEWLQRFVPGRDPSWMDVVIDMAGAALGALLAWLVVRAGKPVTV